LLGHIVVDASGISSILFHPSATVIYVCSQVQWGRVANDLA